MNSKSRKVLSLGSVEKILQLETELRGRLAGSEDVLLTESIRDCTKAELQHCTTAVGPVSGEVTGNACATQHPERESSLQAACQPSPSFGAYCFVGPKGVLRSFCL